MGLDDKTGGSFSGQFQLGGRTCKISVTGFQYVRNNYKAVSRSSKYSDISEVLRSSFLCNKACDMRAVIGGLKPSTSYRIKTTHHSTAYDGGRLSLEYQGLESIAPVTLQESKNGEKPNPPLTHEQILKSGKDGLITLQFKNLGSSATNHANLNALEIEEIPDKTGSGGDGELY